MSDPTAVPPQSPAAAAPAPAPGGQPLGKIRSPFGVWILTLITLGIYGLYWWYKANEELNNFNPEIDISPGLSMLALFIPIANIVTVVRTGGRIGHSQRLAMGEDDCSGIIGLLLALIGAFDFIYYQAKLNKLWESQGATKE